MSIAEETLKNQTSQDPVEDWEMNLSDWAAVIGAALGAFMAVLDIQITNASMREIQGSLGLDLSEGGWISTAYLIAEVIAIPMSSFLGKIFGLRRYIQVNIIIFIISSILCGTAWNLQSMIVFRVLQGLSGGTLIPLAFQIMLLYMPQSKRTIGLAIFGMTATLAPTMGPTLGGWLTENYGWRFIFWINLVPGIIMLTLIRIGIPTSRLQLKKLAQFDYIGALLLMIGLGTLTFVLEEGSHVEWFEDFTIKICFLLTVFALPLFIIRQLTAKSPVLNLKLFNDKNFSFSVFVTTISAIALYGGVYSLSIYLGQIQNYSAMQIGEVMMWIGIPQLIVMPMIPFLMKRLDLRVLTVMGLSLFAFSNFLNSHLSYDYAGDNFRLSLIFRAIGQPLFMIPLSQIGMAKVLPSEAGNAASIYNVMRNIGGSIGIALSGTFLVNRTHHHLNHQLEKLNASQFMTMERMTIMQRYFMSLGSDPSTAKIQALKILNNMATRDAIIQSFGDIFYAFSVGLGVCCFILLFTAKSKVNEEMMVE